MSYEPLDIPFIGGVREDVGKRLAVQPTPIESMVNYVVDRRGELVPRDGFSSLGEVGLLGGVRALASVGPELVALTDRHEMRAWLDESSVWRLRGSVSPGGGSTIVIGYDASIKKADIAGTDDHALVVLETTDGKYGVIRAEADDQRVSWDRESQTVDGANVRVVANSSRAHVYSLNSGSLRVDDYAWGTEALPTTPNQVLTEIGHYDADVVDGGDIAVGYVNDGGEAFVAVYQDGSPSTTQIDSDKLDTDYSYRQIAVSTDGSGRIAAVVVADTENENQFFILAFGWSWNGSTLTPLYSSVVLRTTPGVDQSSPGPILGLTCGLQLVGANWQLGAAWTEVYEDERGLESRFVTRAHLASAPVFGGTNMLPNCVAVSRPWLDGSAWHIAYRSRLYWETPLDGFADGYTVPQLWEADFLWRWSERQGLVGSIEIGTPGSLNGGDFPTPGICSTGTRRRWGGTVLRESRQTVVGFGGNQVVGQATLSGCVHTVDLGEVPMVASTLGGGIVGGTAVSWYDGSQMQELGQLWAPIPYLPRFLATDTTNGQFSVADEPAYTGHWESFDALGYLHRGYPSLRYPREITVTTPNQADTLTLQWRCIPTTRREDAIPVVVEHRELDGLMRSLGSKPQNENDSSVPTRVEGFIDADVSETSARLALAPLLYTTGGELEAVAPEGGRIVAVTHDRVFLAQQWRRDRIAHSKLIRARPNEAVQLAPEFSEGLTLRLDGEVTGLGVLDRSVAAFTRDRVYLLAGEGPNDVGAGAPYAPQQVTADGGCIEPLSVVSAPVGVLFRGPAGMMMLDRGFSVQFVGERVRELTETYPEVTSSTIDRDGQRVLWTIQNTAGNDGRILVYDYRVDEWSVWELGGSAVPQCGVVHQGIYHVATTTGAVWAQSPTATSDPTGDFARSVTTGWIQASGAGGYHRLRRLYLLGERLGYGDLTMSVSTSFDPDSGSDQSYTWSSATLAALPRTPDALLRLQVRDQKAHAHRVTIEDDGSGAGYRLSGLRVEVRRRRDGGKVSVEAR